MCQRNGLVSAGCPSAGFTLIEVLVVAACVGVLAMLAYPSYTESVRRAARSNAQADLMMITQVLEKRYAGSHRYGADDGEFSGADGLPLTQSPRIGEARYLITGVVSEGGQGYTVQARPQGPQAGDRCGMLGIRHTGAQMPTLGTDGRPCW